MVKDCVIELLCRNSLVLVLQHILVLRSSRLEKFWLTFWSYHFISSDGLSRLKRLKGGSSIILVIHLNSGKDFGVVIGTSILISNLSERSDWFASKAFDVSLDLE